MNFFWTFEPDKQCNTEVVLVEIFEILKKKNPALSQRCFWRIKMGQ